mmetsp:Transcript_7587/g.5734  ORF Transcript_7587/g.5734 Transcript_7587/m.5734 type:complete len:110 (+) Transcript_7587:728-1057(+)
MNPYFNEYKFPQVKVHTWSNVFKDKESITRQAIDLISKIIVYDPEKRLKPLEALTHPFFDELRLQSTKLPNGNPLPKELFKFSQEEMMSTSKDNLVKLVPDWWSDEESN